MADNNGTAAARVPRPKVVQPKPTNKAPPAIVGNATTAATAASAPRPAPGPAIQNSAQPTTAAGPSSRPIAPKIVSSVGSGSSILAHPQQKGNPLLKELTHQRWEHAEIAPDYHIAQSTCALFLQLKYHRLHPEYIHQRIKAIGGMYMHRLLILQHDVDASSSEPAIRELTKISLVNNLTLLLAWTPQEAAQWLEKYKMCEFKGAEMIRGRIKETQRERMSDVLTQPTGVNKTDATALMTRFGSIRSISQATADDLSNIPGMGEIKIKRLREAFTTPFRTDEKRTYRERKAARLEEEGGDTSRTTANEDDDDLDGQEALAGLGGEDGPGGFVGRPVEVRSNTQAEPPPPDEFADLSDEGFDLDEEELALLEAPVRGSSGASTQNGAQSGIGVGQTEQSRQTDARLHAQAQTIQRQKAALEQGGPEAQVGGTSSAGLPSLEQDKHDFNGDENEDEDVDSLVHFEDMHATGAAQLPPRQHLQPAERAIQQDEEEEAAAAAAEEGGGTQEELEGMDGLTQEEREELRLAMEMSLAGDGE